MKNVSKLGKHEGIATLYRRYPKTVLASTALVAAVVWVLCFYGGVSYFSEEPVDNLWAMIYGASIGYFMWLWVLCYIVKPNRDTRDQSQTEQ